MFAKGHLERLCAIPIESHAKGNSTSEQSCDNRNSWIIGTVVNKYVLCKEIQPFCAIVYYIVYRVDGDKKVSSSKSYKKLNLHKKEILLKCG